MTRKENLSGRGMFFAVCFLILSSTCLWADETLQRPVVRNTGFEELDSKDQPIGWTRLPGKWSIDSEVSHNGKNSLRIENDDSSWYEFPFQEIFPVPGKSYRVTIWVKVENVKGGKASFCAEYMAPNWDYLGGEYQAFPSADGTSDWKQMVANEVIFPDRYLCQKVGHIRLPVYLTKGGTGTIWFDDLSVEELPPPVLETFLLEPNYRGLLIPEISPQIRVQATLHPEVVGVDLEDYKNLAIYLTLEKKGLDGNEILQQEIICPPAGKEDIDLNLKVPAGLSKGDYILHTQLKKRKSFLFFIKEEESVAETMEPIKCITLSDKDSYAVFIDKYNRVLCKGVPFFPLGFYTANTELPPKDLEGEIKRFVDSPFDTFTNYNTLQPLSWTDIPEKMRYDFILRRYLDLLTKNNIRILSAIPYNFELGISASADKNQKIVDALKDHPAILGWYLNDEQGPIHLQRMTAHNQAVHGKDPIHPTWQVHYQLEILRRMASATDILGVDPYPVPHTSVTYVSDAAEAAREAGRYTRPFWIVLQAFHPTTKEQVRCMTYLGLIHGACGLFYYSYFDLMRAPDAKERWEWVKEIGYEVKSLRPILLSIEDEGDKSGISCDEPEVHFLVKRHQNNFYLILVNSSEDKTVKATFKGMGKVSLGEQLKNFIQTTDAPQKIENNQFSISLAPMERKVYFWPAE